MGQKQSNLIKMKKIFPGYYPMTQVEATSFFENAVFVIDTCFLLDIFRLEENDANCLLTILKSIKSHLWLPYDIAWLYHQSINNEIIQQITNIQSTLHHLTSCKESILGKRRYPYLDTEMTQQLNALIEQIHQTLDDQISTLSQTLQSDNRKETINELFDNRIGDSYSDAELNEIYLQAQTRYSNSIPPGYCTEQNPNKRIMFHDMIIWGQMQRFALEHQKDVIFATGKTRDDWFYSVYGKIISPRQELINEFYQKTKQRFYCLNSATFIKECCQTFNIVQPQLSHLLDQLSEEIGYTTSSANTITDPMTNSTN